MKRVIAGAFLGGFIGITAPIGLAITNELVYAASKGNIASTRICFADRHWEFFALKIKHAKGCRNQILESIPLWFVLFTASGGTIGIISTKRRKSKKNLKITQNLSEAKESREGYAENIAPEFIRQDEIESVQPTEQDFNIESPLKKDFDTTINSDKRRSTNSESKNWSTFARYGALAGISFIVLLGIANTINNVQSPNSKNSNHSMQNSASGNNNDASIKPNNKSVYTAKNDDGIKFTIKEEDVRCKKAFSPAVDRGPTTYYDSYKSRTAYTITECKANGFTEDLSGKTAQWTGSYKVCKRGEYTWKIFAKKDDPYSNEVAGQQRIENGRPVGGTVPAITGRQPTNFNCTSALYYGKYIP